MLTIILGILKVIGCLLLILLGIILLILLLALFCPVRYRGAAQRADGQQLIASGDITWFLHLLHLHVTVEGTAPSVTIRIFGISTEQLAKLTSVFKKKPETSEEKAEKKDTENIEDSVSAPSETKSADSSNLTANSNTKSLDDKECTAEKATISVKDDLTTDSKHVSMKEKIVSTIEMLKTKIISISKKILDIIKMLIHLPSRLTTTIKRVISGGKAASQKISALKAFVSTQEFKAALTLVFGKVMRLFRHFLPKKLAGEIEFGFSDPADTGMVLAAAAPFYPCYAEYLKVCPDFQEKRLSFSVKFKGRIYGCILLMVVIQLMLDRNIRMIIGKIRKKEV